MLISTRAVARDLEDVGLSRPQALRVVAAGLAGPSVVTARAVLYDQATVERLVARERVDEAVVDAACPHGLFIARRLVDTRRTAAEQREVLRPGWTLPAITAVWLRTRILQFGPFPLVATVGGFVVCGADLTDVLPHAGTRRLELSEPGPWFEALADKRLEAGPGHTYAIRNLQYSAHRVGSDGRQLQPRPIPRGRPLPRL